MKKFFQMIMAKVHYLFTSASVKAKQFIPIAVNIVEAIKKFNDSKAMDFFEFIFDTAVPSTAPKMVVDKARQLIREKLPVILVELKIIESIADLTNDADKVKAILSELKLTSTKGILYKGIAGKALELMADGEFSFDDSCDLTRFAFEELKKANAQP